MTTGWNFERRRDTCAQFLIGVSLLTKGLADRDTNLEAVRSRTRLSPEDALFAARRLADEHMISFQPGGAVRSNAEGIRRADVTRDLVRAEAREPSVQNVIATGGPALALLTTVVREEPGGVILCRTHRLSISGESLVLEPSESTGAEAPLSSRGRARAYPIPPDEAKRLETAHRFDFLSDPSFESGYLEGLDHTCELARTLLGCDKAYVSFVFEDHQRLVAQDNVKVAVTSRQDSICAHTICQDDFLLVEDATLDPRFADKPIVTGAFQVVAYAGAPLQFDGQCVGTFCVVHGKPRAFSEPDLEGMERLTTLVLDQLRLLVAYHELDQASMILRGAERLEQRGSWELDFDKRAFFWSEEMHRLHGYRAADPVPVERLARFYPNGGHQQFLDAIGKAAANGSAFDLELAYRPVGAQVDTGEAGAAVEASHDDASPDANAVRWCRIHGQADPTESGPPHVYGTFRDITDIRRGAEQWRQRRSSTMPRQ